MYNDRFFLQKPLKISLRTSLKRLTLCWAQFREDNKRKTHTLYMTHSNVLGVLIHGRNQLGRPLQTDDGASCKVEGFASILLQRGECFIYQKPQ